MEGEDPDWWMEKRCPAPRRAGRKPVPLQNGTVIATKPCDRATCPVCAVTLACDWLEVVRDMSPNVWGVLQMDRVRYQAARKRMNHLLGDFEAGGAAWYLCDSEERTALEARLAIRVENIHSVADQRAELESAAGRRRSHVVTFRPLASIEELDELFLADLRAAFGLPLEEAELLVERHLELNGPGTVHVTDGYLRDEENNPLDKKRALEGGRKRHR